MAKLPMISLRGLVAVNQGVTSYCPISSGSLLTNATEAFSQRTTRAPGVFSNLYIRISANTLTGTCTVRFRKNGVNGNQVIVIGAGLTGEFTDSVNTDTVAAGDIIGLSITNAAGGTSITYAQVGGAFSASTNSVSNHSIQTVTSPLVASTKYFQRINGNTVTEEVTTETAVSQFKVPVAGVLKNLCVSVATNNRTSSTTMGIRKNGVDTALVVTIPALTNGQFENTTDTVTVAAGDLISRFIQAGTGTDTIFFWISYTDFETTGQSAFYTAQVASQSVPAATTRYATVSGNAASSTVELDTQRPLLQVGNVTGGRVYVSANACTTASTLTLRKNGADTAMAITIPAASTGWFEDTTNTISYNATDEVNWKLDTGATGALVYEQTGLAFTAVTGSAVNFRVQENTRLRFPTPTPRP